MSGCMAERYAWESAKILDRWLGMAEWWLRDGWELAERFVKIFKIDTKFTKFTAKGKIARVKFEGLT